MARKTETDKINSKEEEKNQKFFFNVRFGITSVKNAHLTKHITSKHYVHKCKVCQKKFKTSLDPVSHVAKEHLEDEGELSF